MTDQTSDEPTGQETLPLPAKKEAGKETTPDFITSEQLEAAVKTITKEFKGTMDSYNREIQSREGKFMAGVKRRVTQLEEAAETAGVSLSDAQRESLQGQAILEGLSELTSEPSGGKTPDQVPTGDDENKRVNLVADSLMKASGVVINDDDPEVKLIKKSEDGTEREYYAAVLNAIETKEARLKAQPESKETEDPNKTRARVPGAVKGSSAPPNYAAMSDEELWKTVKEEGKIK
jgi:hypothetical protein